MLCYKARGRDGELPGEDVAESDDASGRFPRNPLVQRPFVEQGLSGRRVDEVKPDQRAD